MTRAAPARPQYRMYVDEVGNPGLACSSNPQHRYLSLTGVVVDLDYADGTLVPALERLKRTFFTYHADEPPVLHRKELVNRQAPFDSLQDPEVAAAFDADLLSLLGDLEYSVITVVIDKHEHMSRYERWRHDPYHYCLRALLERFVYTLGRQRARGDVMAESRGGKEDRRLKAAFHRIWTEGTEFVRGEDLQGRLTSSQLKVRPKLANVAGLQLADLIAHPSFSATLARHHRTPLPATFGGKVAAILEKREYQRRPRDGHIDGWGRVWLP